MTTGTPSPDFFFPKKNFFFSKYSLPTNQPTTDEGLQEFGLQLFYILRLLWRTRSTLAPSKTWWAGCVPCGIDLKEKAGGDWPMTYRWFSMISEEIRAWCWLVGYFPLTRGRYAGKTKPPPLWQRHLVWGVDWETGFASNILSMERCLQQKCEQRDILHVNLCRIVEVRNSGKMFW